MLDGLQIIKRVNRIEQGNFGDHKFCRDGVWEMRIDVGAGYRVYYARSWIPDRLSVVWWRQKHTRC